MPFSSDSKPHCPGSECSAETLEPLTWQTLAIRFDHDVLAADFGAWIEKDLAVMESRLNQFATQSRERRSR